MFKGGNIYESVKSELGRLDSSFTNGIFLNAEAIAIRNTFISVINKMDKNK